MRLTILSLLTIFYTSVNANILVTQTRSEGTLINGEAFNQYFNDHGSYQKLDDQTLDLLTRICTQVRGYRQDLGNNTSIGMNTSTVLVRENDDRGGFYLRCKISTSLKTNFEKNMENGIVDALNKVN